LKVQDNIDQIQKLYDEMQARFAAHCAELRANPSFWSRITSDRRDKEVPPIWLEAKAAVLSAIQSNDLIELASLLNLHALNSAIEAARNDDRILAGLAEEMRMLAEDARRFPIG
jgi:predicted transcriptional regulator